MKEIKQQKDHREKMREGGAARTQHCFKQVDGMAGFVSTTSAPISMEV